MPVITALRATRSGRVAVHLDGSFCCAVSERLTARLHLHTGRNLTADEVDRLHWEAAVDQALAAAHRLLAHRARSRAELAARLQAKGHSPPAVDEAVGRLAEDGILDDADFARAFVHDRSQLAGWGSQRIARELSKLGVDKETSAAALASILGEGDELGRARAALARRSRPQPPVEAARRRAFAFLCRRGFPSSVAYEAVALWINEERTPPAVLEGRAQDD